MALSGLDFNDLWDDCKIVERKESGYLMLNKSNLENIIKSLKSESKIVFLALIGPPESGTSFYTNLILENLRQEGKANWIYKFTKDKHPLTGFSYGHGGNRVTNGCFDPDNCSSGIYCWPQTFLVNQQRQCVWVLHVHYTPLDEWRGPFDSLHVLLTTICSVLVEIKKSEDKGCQLLDIQKVLGREALPKTISILIQGETKKEADQSQSSLRQSFRNRNDINYHFIYRSSQESYTLHDDNGNLTLPPHRSQQLSTCIDHIAGKKEVAKFQSTLKPSDLPDFLEKHVKVVNGMGKIKKWEWCADRVTLLISQVYPNQVHEEMEGRLQKWLRNPGTVDLTQVYNQCLEYLTDKVWQTIPQTEPDRVDTMSRFKDKLRELMTNAFLPFITGIQGAVPTFKMEMQGAALEPSEKMEELVERAINNSIPPAMNGTPVGDVIAKVCRKLSEPWIGKKLEENLIAKGELVLQLVQQYPYGTDEERNQIIQQLGNALANLRRDSWNVEEVTAATELIKNILDKM